MDTSPADLQRLRSGDEAAWRDLHRDHYPRLWSSVQRILNNPASADDVVQETFIKAHRDIHRFNGQSQLGTWLYRIAINQALDTVRKKARTDRWLSFLSPVATRIPTCPPCRRARSLPPRRWAWNGPTCASASARPWPN